MKIYSCQALLYAGDMIIDESDEGSLDCEETKKLNFENLLLTEQKLRESVKNKNAGQIKGKISIVPHFIDEAICQVKFELIPSQTTIDYIDANPGQPEFYLDGLSLFGPDVVPNPGEHSLEIWVTKQRVVESTDKSKWSRSCSMSGERRNRLKVTNNELVHAIEEMDE